MCIAYGTGIIHKPGKAYDREINFKISERALALGLEGLQKNIEIKMLFVPRALSPKLAAFVTKTGLGEIAPDGTRALDLPFRIFGLTPGIPPEQVMGQLLSLKVAIESHRCRN